MLDFLLSIDIIVKNITEDARSISPLIFFFPTWINRTVSVDAAHTCRRYFASKLHAETAASGARHARCAGEGLKGPRGAGAVRTEPAG